MCSNVYAHRHEYTCIHPHYNCVFLHRSLSYKNPASPNHKMQLQEQDYQQQQRQQQQSKPKVRPRTTVPVTDSPANTSETYEYMSSKGVPLPAGDNNVYDDPQESLPRY